jgi:hypothetical protein
MKSIDQIERLLGQTPAPCVVEGPHREKLKQQLLEKVQSAQPRREEMRMSLLKRVPSMMKLAAALLVAAVLVGTGWAAEKVYKKLTKTVILERRPVRTRTLPNGRTVHGGWGIGTQVSSEDPNAVETAKRHHEEMKQLIAQKKYELIKTRDHGIYGPKGYLYKFTFSDGSNGTNLFLMPLENVDSWEDYWQKQEKREEQRDEQISKAIAAGKFRLIDVVVMQFHICRDVGSDRKIEFQRLPGPQGKDFADEAPTLDNLSTFVPGKLRMSWQDHLQAIRDGKRELLDVRIGKNYAYEMVLEDGSKAVYWANGKPLKKPEEK